MRTARRDVDVVVTRPIAAPAWAVLDVLHDLEFIAEFEPTVASVSVHPTTPTRGTYEVNGQLFGLLRWHGTFEYTLADDGFHSHMTELVGGVSVSGGFSVEPKDQGCVVTHYECYDVPLRAAWTRRAWGAYMQRTMKAELSAIDVLARGVLARPQPVRQR